MLSPVARSPQRGNSFVADNFADWRRRMSSRFVRLSVSTDQPAGFRGQVLGRDFDEVSVSRVCARAHEVARLPALISPEEPRFVKFSLQLSGSLRVIQDGREALLGPGDMAVYETSRPYRLVCGDDSESLVMIFPSEALTCPTHALAAGTAIRLTGSRGVGRVVRPLFQELGERVLTLPGAAGTRLAHHAVDLVDTLLFADLDLHRQHRGHPLTELLAQVKEYIEHHLHDPGLGPTSIARAHHISVRHLHHLFESEGATVSSCIRKRRLEMCRRALLDPAHGEETITTIAYRWGFVESAHFSRVFKQQFGLPPSTYRSRYTTRMATEPTAV